MAPSSLLPGRVAERGSRGRGLGSDSFAFLLWVCPLSTTEKDLLQEVTCLSAAMPWGTLWKREIRSKLGEPRVEEQNLTCWSSVSFLPLHGCQETPKECNSCCSHSQEATNMINNHVTFSIDPWIPLVFPHYSVLKLIKTFSIEVCLLQSNTRVLCTWSSIDISDRGPFLKGAQTLRFSMTWMLHSRGFCSLRANPVVSDQAFQGLSVALYVSDPTQERGLAQRPGDGKVGGGPWQDSGPQVTWTLLISHSMAQNHLLRFLCWNLLPPPRFWSMSFQIKP